MSLERLFDRVPAGTPMRAYRRPGGGKWRIVVVIDGTEWQGEAEIYWEALRDLARVMEEAYAQSATA